MKPLAEWVIDSKLWLKNNPFLFVRLQTIFFLTLLILVIVFIFAGLLEYNRNVIVEGITDSIEHTLETGEVDGSIMAEVDEETWGANSLILITVVIITVVAGVIASYLSLRPLSQAVHQQKKFIGSIAHELRTPLAVIKTNNEVLLLDEGLPDSTKSLLEENVSDINYITDILNALLIINRTDSRDSVQFESMEVDSLLTSVTGQLAGLAKKKGIAVHLEDMAPPPIHGNKSALGQVFFNLLKNAILYTPHGGRVDIRCARVSDNSVMFEIKDNGPGIPTTDIPHIFDPFFRTSKEEELVQDGTGLGLSIVFEIIKLHEGKIFVESLEGVGTSFFVTLPRDERTYMRKSKHHTEEGLEFDFSRHI